MKKTWSSTLILAGAVLAVIFAVVILTERHSPGTVVSTSTSNAQNQPLSHKLDCALEMIQFKDRITNQQKITDSNASVYDFFIAYSPSLDTCVGGYTKYLNYKFTGTGVNRYDFEIEDALTGVNVDNFSGYGTDSQAVWVQYKNRLSVLTGGVIPAASN